MIAVEVYGFRMWGDPPLGYTELSIPPGLAALGGPNGSGKSTLLQALGEVLTGRLSRVRVADIVFRLFDSDEQHDALSDEILSALQYPDFEGTTADLFGVLVESHLEPGARNVSPTMPCPSRRGWLSWQEKGLLSYA